MPCVYIASTVDVKEFGFMEVVPHDPMTIEEGDEEGEEGEDKDGAEATPAAVETVAIDAMANGAHGMGNNDCHETCLGCY